MAHSLIANSHVDTEEHEFLWTIDNFDFLSVNPDLLEEHVFPFTIGSSVDKVSKWKLFLLQQNITSSRSTSLFLQLVECNSSDEKIPIAIQVLVENGDCAKFECNMSPLNFTLRDDKVKCNMLKYVKGRTYDSDGCFTSKTPCELDRHVEQILSLEEICDQLGSNYLRLFITMKIFGKESFAIVENTPPTPIMAAEQAKSIRNQKQVMLAMLDTGLGSDVTFVTRDNQRIPAHKCILSMHSAVFAAEMKEKTDGVVKLAVVGGEGLKILLKFLYTGELEKTWGKFYEEILNAAKKYQITPLISMCDKMLPTVVSLENCIELLKFTELHGMTDAKEKVKSFMKGHPEKLLQFWHVAAFGSRLGHDSSSDSVFVPENINYQNYVQHDDAPHYYDEDGIDFY